ELGPMLRPKFDSILLMAASTCHGTSYCAPAACHRASSCESGSGASVAVASGASGVTSGVGTTVNVSARAAPATSARRTRAAATARFISPCRDDAQPGVERRGSLGRDRLLRWCLRCDICRRGGRGCALDLLRALERDEEVVPVRRRVRRDLAVDLAGEHVRDERLREGLHAEVLALGDRVGDLVGAPLADE